MQAILMHFGNFYKEKHQGHKFEWDHALGTVTMRAAFQGGVKELSVSLYQAVILLLFNAATELPLEEIHENTCLGAHAFILPPVMRVTNPSLPPADDAELRRTLQSLACGKKRVLQKRPAGKDVCDGDVFEFNDAFTDSHTKVHINTIQVKETVCPHHPIPSSP